MQGTYCSFRMDTTTLQPDAFEQTAPGSVVRDAAPAAPGQANGGGTALAEIAASGEAAEGSTPRLVIRGESLNLATEHSSTANSNSAFVDWLNFTFDCPVFDFEEFQVLKESFTSAFGFTFSHKRSGKFLNYETSYELGESGAIFGVGGSSVNGTAIVSIPGRACHEVRNWFRVYELLRTLKAKITRIDFTHDDLDGKYNIEAGMFMYESGGFTNKGRSPSRRLINDFDSGKGKTLEIGSRDNGKLLRIYEKGKKEGDPNSPWVRWELELRSQDRVIPLETIIWPGKYLAGAYPCLDWVCGQQSRIKTVTQTTKIRFAAYIKNCKNSYGRLIWFLHDVLGYDAEDIIAELKQEGYPKRLANIPQMIKMAE